MMAEESAVKVCIRVRPLIEREEATAKEGTKPVMYWKTDKKSVQNCVDDGNATKCFNFDRVFGANESTAQLYHDIAMPLVSSAVQGYNGTIFAYGQTSSGKTFTMMGSESTPGVIPLAMEDVFQTIKIKYPKKEFLLRVSYMEIYNETVADLLVDNWKRKPLEVREDSHKTVYVADLTEELVINPSQALAWIRKGEKNRHYEKTKMNQRSSRSHTIFRMILESREDGDGENADGAITVSHLNLVDLAGSERASQTGAEGARFKEGCNINKSLFTLGQVIKKLSEENQRGFTNYRDSKLTRILQNSLGGNAKTVIICTITPATMDETLSTLQFASTAKYMKNDPHVTEVSDDGALLKRYRNEIVDLKRRLHEVSSVTQTTATEKESLFLLLQEKEQLRIEQTDKIHNLTRLLVTSTSFVTSNKMPKRRVTWGGKLIRPTEPSDGHVRSDLSFAEPVTRKMTTLSEQDDEEFESRWGSPYESSYCPEMNQNSFSSFGDSPQIADKVSELENRLKAETNQKEEAESRLRAETDQKEKAESRLKAETDQKEEAESRLKAETDQKEEAESRLRAETDQKEKAESRLKAETDQKEEAESRLKVETDQKAEALAKAETLHRRVEELEAQLAIEALQTHGAMEKMAAAENAAVGFNLQLEVETQQKLESVVMLELRVADLERQLQEWTDSTSKADEIQKRYDDTVQLFDSLVSNQEAVIAEKNQMKQEVDFLKEQAEWLEQEKEELSQELAEKRDLEEFNSLEKDEHEQELKREMSSLKKDLESAEYKCQEFEARISLMSEDLKKQSDWVEELQSLKDKDLVQEVSRLRRSLDDAEGLGRDTKKEWAILRSQNISLKERDVAQTANYEKMEAGVSGLHHQVETEKSRYKKMQADLQRELNMAFDENTKLTTLLNGKVPKNLIDSMTLEREVTNLKKELTVCHDKEGELQAQLQELSPLQHLPDKVDNLLKQVCDLTEALCTVESQRDSLLSGQAQSQEESHQLRDALQTLQGELAVAEHKEAHLTQRCADTTDDLDTVRADLARLDAERTQLLATVQDTRDRLNESDKQQTALGENLNEMQQLIKDLEEKLVDSEQSKNMEEEIGKELQEQVSQLTEELQNARAERDGLLSEKESATLSATEQVDSLLSKVSSLTEESDQLKVDLQESVDMNREELRTTLEENCLQKENIKRLEETLEERHSQIQGLEQELDGVKEERNELKDDLRENVDMAIENQQDLMDALEKIKQLENGSCAENVSHMEELQNQNRQLSDELASLKAERDGLLSSDSFTMSTVTCLTEERDQLKEILEGLRQEKNQLRADLEANMETVVETSGDLRTAQEKIKQLESGSCAENVSCLEELQNQNRQLSEELDRVRAERDGLFSNASATEEVEKLLSTVSCLTEEGDQLKEILEALRQDKNQLRAELEANMEMTIEKEVELRDADEKITLLKEEVDLLRTRSEQQENESCPENVSHLEELKNQNQELVKELAGLRAERDGLLSSTSATMSTVTSLTEERDQLKEMHEGLRQEKIQLGADLEANMETSRAELGAARDTIERLDEEVYLLNTNAESHAETVSHLEKLKNEKTEKQEELDAAQEKIGHLKEEVGHLKTQIEQLENERRVENVPHLEELQNQNQQLSKELAGLRAERDGLLSSEGTTMSTVTSLTEERDQLKEMHEGLRQEKIQLGADLEANMEKSRVELGAAHDTIKRLNEEVDLLNTHTESHAENVSHLEKLKNEKTEKQEELNAAQEKIGHLKEEVGHLKTQIEQLENERRVENFSHLDELQNQNQQLVKELASLRVERDGLLSSTSATMSTVTSLTEERDQLKEMHEGLRQEKIQLGADLEANMETNQQLSKELECLRAERDGLLSSEGTTVSTVTSLTEERDQLKEMHEGLRQEKIQLGADLEANMETSRAELRAAHDTIERLNEEVELLNTQNKSRADDISHLEELQNKTLQLSEDLDRVKTERDGLVSNTKISTEELEKLTSRVTCLTDERDQLQKELDAAQERTRLLKQEVDVLNSGCKQLEQLQNKIKVLEQELERVKEERNQLKNDLQENVDKTIQNQLELGNADEKSRLLDEEVNLLRTQSEELQNQIEQLSEELDIVKIDKLMSQSDLIDANEKLTLLTANAATRAVQMSSRLQDSVEQLQNYLHGFQVFMDDLCSSTTTQSLKEAYRVQISLVINFASLHYPTKEAYVVLSRNIDWILLKKQVLLKSYAQDFMHVFKDLFQKDLDLFEEKRLQDVLMCKSEATLFSVADEDFQELWQQRLTELLDKRHFYLQKIPNVLEKMNLWRELTDKELSDELGETERFTEQLRALSNNQHLDSTSLDSIFSSRVTCRSAALDHKKKTLEALRGDIRPLFNKVKILRGDAAIQLKQEMSNTATLLQTRGEITPLKTEVGLLKENQQLILQLQQSEKQIEALLGQMTQLEQAQVNATSTHKEVTQLLQTQLQDVYAEVQTLKDKLQSVKTTEEQKPLAMEAKKLKAELVKMQLEFTSQSTDYEGRLQTLNKALDEKAIELRQLKMKMRTAQQEQEGSFLQGKELCGKLRKAKGATVESSTHLEEVKRLLMKISELESQVSGQQKEITKWKGRAVMLKEKTKVSVADKPMPRSPCTPTKRQLPVTFGSPHLNSPKKTPRKIPDSPMTTAPGAAKSSSYFDSESEQRSKNQPIQFFDNSSLGSTADLAMTENSISPDPQNLGGGAEKVDEWWPKSPKQDEMCKNQ